MSLLTLLHNLLTPHTIKRELTAANLRIKNLERNLKIKEAQLKSKEATIEQLRQGIQQLNESLRVKPPGAGE